MAQRKSKARKKASGGLRARAAQVVPRPSGGRLSVIETIPGLVEDLRQTIEDQKNLAPARRLSVAQLFEMACDEYPELEESGLSYNAFWKYVTRVHRYRPRPRKE